MTPPLSDYPDRQRAIWANLRPYAWERAVARQFVAGDDVVELLDAASYFDRIDRPVPASRDLLLADLAKERLIARDVGGRWNILNLGAILFALDLRAFDSSLSRKSVRFVANEGDDRTSTVTHRSEFRKGYAVCLEAVNEHVNTLVPSPEDNGAVVRRAKPLFPTVAVREMIANALIHQDMTITGAGPIIELFRSRLEITNPGAPLIETDRFIDAPSRSRNEALAALMRRMGLCEEGGTGIDKVVDAVESEHLPPPEFRAEDGATRVVLLGPRRFAELTTEERHRACYLHAGLTCTSPACAVDGCETARCGSVSVSSHEMPRWSPRSSAKHSIRGSSGPRIQNARDRAMSRIGPEEGRLVGTTIWTIDQDYDRFVPRRPNDSGSSPKIAIKTCR